VNPIECYLDQIILGDSLSVMRQMPGDSVDLVITSPPYNIKNSTGNGLKHGTKTGKWSSAALQNGYSHHDDNMPHEEYEKWQNACLKEMFRLLKPSGAIFYNHKRRVQGGLLQDRDAILEGLPVRQIIIWKRAGGINFNPGYFLPTHEVIYLIPKPEFKLVPKANAYGDVWEFNQEMKNSHPAPFPLALPQRCIESTDANIVLDPFMGSGTTALAAKLLGKKYIGIEISEEYVEMANDRLSEYLFTASTVNGKA
jgi:site-specific DNA-methyltransferase (adenine-specific)